MSNASLLEALNDFTVIGYFIGKSKKTGNEFTAVRVLTPSKTTTNGMGQDVQLVFLPDAEKGKVNPNIIGKVVHCDTDMLGGRSNFLFMDD